MKLWLDDVRDAPDDSWMVARTAPECIAFLQTVHVDRLSLDHDLGEGECGSGYDIVVWMELETYTNLLFNPPAIIEVHSANPVGRKNMFAGIESIRKIAGNRIKA